MTPTRVLCTVDLSLAPGALAPLEAVAKVDHLVLDRAQTLKRIGMRTFVVAKQLRSQSASKIASRVNSAAHTPMMPWRRSSLYCSGSCW